MPDPSWLLFTTATLLIALGILGTLLPIIPGLGLIFTTITLVKILRPDTLHTALPIAAGTAFLTLWLLESIAGGIGAKLLGGTRWGILGAILGGLLGLILFPIGLILGPILGAITAEITLGKHSLAQATKIGIAAGFSLITILLLKLLTAITLGILFILDYLH